MFDISSHKYYLVRILKDIYSDPLLSSVLGFKGGTAHMLFYNLPRFSVDLDFNLLDKTESDLVFQKLRNILSSYGQIKDEAQKYYGLLLVLNYGAHNRNLKLEISNREYKDRYQNLNYLGIMIKVMHVEDMFTHKLCALTDRKSIAGRDVFDIYYFLKDNIKINHEIIKQRTNMDVSEYIEYSIYTIKNIKKTSLLNGIGELVDEDVKSFVKNKLQDETINLLGIYKNIYL
ncbi:MAG: nucleotidyl transferase AbiEii/AbiGii toxin family protein [Bacteroidales bacterium]|nr:nucleotidyl transferase AbiEii/AbiGii toxin family protein [Bacteroidales bacterium]MDD4235262.1 nucleotidyl transferase AbiEii/AbiGii toxin family protein [Bacteroidales bacterium]